jgi:hypothetical protein
LARLHSSLRALRLQPQSAKAGDSNSFDSSILLGTADQGQTLQNGLHARRFSDASRLCRSQAAVIRKSYKQSCFELTVTSVSIPLIRHVAQLFFATTEVASQKLEGCTMSEARAGYDIP